MKNKYFAILSLLLCLSMILFSGCSGEKKNNSSDNTSSAVSSDGSQLTNENETQVVIEKTGIDLFFELCSVYAEQNGGSMRTSSDAWHEEAVSDTQTKYTSLGSKIIDTVLFDKERDYVISVSSQTDLDSYADEAIRADMIFDISVLSAAMTKSEDTKAVEDYRSGFESVIESGIEMFLGDAKLSMEVKDNNVIMTAELTNVIYD